MGIFDYLTVSLLLLISIEATSSAIITPPTNETTPTKPKRTNQEDELNQEDALSSSHFIHTPEDLGVAEGTFDPSTDYGSFFDHFADLPYFPEFGEIFRLSRTTTPRPPFGFPAYVRDAFPSGGGVRDSIGGSGSGGRRQRRPPRPASSGTRTNKVPKQTEPSKEKPRSPSKSKSNPNKARNFPKIFRFTADRVNLADFDMKKKVNENYLALTKGDDLDSDKVKRNEFLILHGGVFEIESRGGKGGRPLLTAATHRQSDTTPSDFSNSYEESDDSAEELESARYFYKT